MNKTILLLSAVYYLFSVQGVADEHPPPEPSLDFHLSEPTKGDLPDMLDRQYIRVLTTINHTNFFLDGLRAHGYEYSLLKQYERKINKGKSRKKLRTVLEFIPFPRDKLFEDLINGYGDIAAAGLTITPRRQMQVDFTNPYLYDISEILVTFKDTKPINIRDEMSGKEVFIRKSSSYYESIMALSNMFKLKGKKPVKIVEADENLETEDILEMVNSGAVAMTVCDSHIAEIWSKVLPDIRLYKDITFRKGGKIAWAVRKGSPLLLKSLNGFIKENKKGTLMGNMFFNRYYENMNWIKNPLNGRFEKKAAKIIPIIKKYSRQYDFDWKLILSMAFQESGLNPGKESPEGAIGLMQIKPSTASDPIVDIKYINKLDNNVHAAVKYLDFIRRHYFTEKDIRPRDQVRFTLAAYNAGPAKINRARQRAKRMNLDPNRWFRNVEIAVLRSVGQETVKYVSNINKYYVIYNNYLGIKETREMVKEEIQIHGPGAE